MGAYFPRRLLIMGVALGAMVCGQSCFADEAEPSKKKWSWLSFPGVSQIAVLNIDGVLAMQHACKGFDQGAGHKVMLTINRYQVAL